MREIHGVVKNTKMARVRSFDRSDARRFRKQRSGVRRRRMSQSDMNDEKICRMRVEENFMRVHTWAHYLGSYVNLTDVGAPYSISSG